MAARYESIGGTEISQPGTHGTAEYRSLKRDQWWLPHHQEVATRKSHPYKKVVPGPKTRHRPKPAVTPKTANQWKK